MINLIVNLLKKNIEHHEVKFFFEALEEKPKIDAEYANLLNNRIDYIFYESGVLIFYDNDNSIITSICIYLKEKDNFKKYTGPFAKDMAIYSNKKVVMKKLGLPSQSRTYKNDILGLPVPDWIRYDYKNYSIHFQFSDSNKKLEKITFMIETVVPKGN